MNKVPRAFEWYITHKINFSCFNRRNMILFKIFKYLIVINLGVKMSGMTINFFNDTIQCKNNIKMSS